MEVGDMVYLNDQGMQSIGGITSAEMMKQALDLSITKVSLTSMCTDYECYLIEVDQPLINKFMLTTMDVTHRTRGGK